MLARFGWKASAVSLASQTADAFLLDMGLSSPLARDAAGDCTARQTDCLAARHGGSSAKAGFEVSAEEIALVVAHLESSAPPADADASSRADASMSRVDAGSGMARDGQRLFDGLGCVACHRPSFSTPETGAEHMSQKTVALYSDLLVHDMGPGLADATVAGEPGRSAEARGWRTAPLWGLGQQIASIAAGQIDGLLHDGRARDIEEAILWHGGEAQAARDAYAGAGENERAALIAYLAGL